MSYDDNIGENYDKIHSIYSDIVKSDTDILKKPKTKSKIEDFLVYLFDWKFVFFFLFTVIVLFTIASNEIRKLLIKFKLYDVYGTDMISFFIYGIIINMFIGLFILTFYFYKKKIIGSKGPRGNIGDKGLQGKNDYCDICTIKPQRIKRSKNLEETVLVDEPENLELLNKEKKGWTKTDVNINIGDSKFCKNCKNKSYIYHPDIKYHNGVIGNFDIKNQHIDSLQFLYKDINNETKLHGGKSGVWGKSKDQATNIKEIICPQNSAIYKIDSMYLTSNPERNATINGIKIYCKDIISNKEVEIEHDIIGVEYDSNSNIYKSSSIQCKDISYNDKNINGFFSNLSAKFEDKINEISFKKCNYYYK